MSFDKKPDWYKSEIPEFERYWNGENWTKNYRKSHKLNNYNNNNNNLSVISLILAFLIPPLGAILGHIAYSNASKNNSSKTAAVISIIVGWIITIIISFIAFLTISIVYEVDNKIDYNNTYYGSQEEIESKVSIYELEQFINTHMDANYEGVGYAYCENGLLEVDNSMTTCMVNYSPLHSEVNEDIEVIVTFNEYNGLSIEVPKTFHNEYLIIQPEHI